MAASPASSAGMDASGIKCARTDSAESLDTAASGGVSAPEHDSLAIFGSWVADVALRAETKPFRHIVIPDFLSEDAFKRLQREAPTPDTTPADSDIQWWHYSNPLEVKYACDQFEKLPASVQGFFAALDQPEIAKKFDRIFGLPEGTLETDPFRHGAGLHCHPQNGTLSIHLDYEQHPRMLDKQRRLNIIFSLNEEWKPEWNGATELWSREVMEAYSLRGAEAGACTAEEIEANGWLKEVHPRRNTALVFTTNEWSYHGVSKRIMPSPEAKWRRTMAYYYCSDLEDQPDPNRLGADPETGYRRKATFLRRPDMPHDSRSQKLMEIRPTRRIEKEDMAAIWPDWTAETNLLPQ